MTPSLSGGDVRRYEYIDLLRAAAILGVMAIHCQQHMPGLSPVVAAMFHFGQMGVQLFFVASALTLCLSAAERGEASPVNFYVRRFFRVAPLYYFGIAFYFGWRLLVAKYRSGSFAVDNGYSLLSVVENLLFVHGFHPSNFNFVVPGGWSIATEMGFYAIFPILHRRMEQLDLAAAVRLALAVAALSFAAQYAFVAELQPLLAGVGLLKTVIAGDDEFNFLYASLANQINVFMIGLVAWKALGRKVRRLHLALAAALMAAACFVLNDHRFDTGYDGFIYPILSAVAFALFGLRLGAATLPNNRLLLILAAVGRNSFSMYLMHFAVLDGVEAVLWPTAFECIVAPDLRLAVLYAAVAGLSYPVARLTNRWIEQPGVRLGKRFLGRRAAASLGRDSAAAGVQRL